MAPSVVLLVGRNLFLRPTIDRDSFRGKCFYASDVALVVLIHVELLNPNQILVRRFEGGGGNGGKGRFKNRNKG